MKKVRLGDVAQYIRGITFKPEDKVSPGEDDAVVCFRTTNIQADLDLSDVIAVPRSMVPNNDQYLRDGDILISSANSWELVGKSCWVSNLPYTATLGGFIAAVRARYEVVNPRYLYHWMRLPQTQIKVRGCARKTTNIANLSVPLFEELELFTPVASEQRRIAAELDRADALARKRREALALTDDLLRATFLEIFGDPIANPRRWATEPLGTHISATPGWSASGEARPATERERGVLKVSAVTSGWYRPEENKAVDEGDLNGRSLVVPRRGDLLFSRANTRELVAAVCLVDEALPNVFLPDKLWRVDLTTGQLRPEYLRYLLSHSRIRERIAATASGSSGSMLNVSQEKVLAQTVPVPPLDQQNQFARFVWKTYEHHGKMLRALDESERLFASLQHRAFQGEL